MRPKIYLKTGSVWDAMKRCEMTAQSHLAKKIGVSDSTVSDAMKGLSISRKTAEAIAKALKVKFDDIAREDRVGVGAITERAPGPTGENHDLRSAIQMLTTINREDPQAWEWITGNLVMFTRAIQRGRKARDTG